MAVKDDIKAIVGTMLPAPTFFFGTEDEFNVFVDDASNLTTNGIFFMYSLQGTGFELTNNNSVANADSLFVAMLYKNEFDGENSDQSDIYFTKSKSMLNQFLIRLSHYRDGTGAKVYKRIVGDKTKPRATRFNYADVNLCGYSFALDLETFKNEKICY